MQVEFFVRYHIVLDILDSIYTIAITGQSLFAAPKPPQGEKLTTKLPLLNFGKMKFFAALLVTGILCLTGKVH